MSDTSTAGHADLPDRGSSGEKLARKDGGPSFFARIALFVRQVIAELRKVIWPTRKELITYTWVVIVFVVAVASIVAVLDLVFGRGVLAIFGS